LSQQQPERTGQRQLGIFQNSRKRLIHITAAFG
jgi:hypothetical protein